MSAGRNGPSAPSVQFRHAAIVLSLLRSQSQHDHLNQLVSTHAVDYRKPCRLLRRQVVARLAGHYSTDNPVGAAGFGFTTIPTDRFTLLAVSALLTVFEQSEVTLAKFRALT